MTDVSEGLEELGEPDAYGNAIKPYHDTGRYIILKGKYQGSFVDTIPRGYLEKVVLGKWDMTNEERAIITACLTPPPHG